MLMTVVSLPRSGTLARVWSGNRCRQIPATRGKKAADDPNVASRYVMRHETCVGPRLNKLSDSSTGPVSTGDQVRH
jgi:hypothetical protein